MQAEKRLEQAKRQLAKAKQEERAKIRAEQNHHKYMLGGCVVKYFPECRNFSKQEMNRIIACAFKSRGVLNMVDLVVKERPAQTEDISESKDFEDTEDEDGDE